MATYGTDKAGVNRNGLIPFTGWTGVLGSGVSVNGVPQGTATGSVYFNGVFQHDHKIAMMLRKPGSTNKYLRQMLFNLIGANFGIGTGTTNTQKRVQAQSSITGTQTAGLVPIENVGVANRATTANDRDAFRAMVFRSTAPTVSFGSLVTNYPSDLSGNGGGGKVAY